MASQKSSINSVESFHAKFQLMRSTIQKVTDLSHLKAPKVLKEPLTHHNHKNKLLELSMHQEVRLNSEESSTIFLSKISLRNGQNNRLEKPSVFSVTLPQSSSKQTILANTLSFAMAALMFKTVNMDLLLQEALSMK
jgi:hypothetical protein